MSITTKAEATEVTLPAVTMTTGYTTSKCYEFVLLIFIYFFPLRECIFYFIFMVYQFALINVNIL